MRASMSQRRVAAHAAGIVFEIPVSAGDAVAVGDTLMILESMKMHTPLQSPAAGVVAEILVVAEDVVDEGQILLVLETDAL